MAVVARAGWRATRRSWRLSPMLNTVYDAMATRSRGDKHPKFLTKVFLLFWEKATAARL
jgi:hypothetical protein